MKKKIILFYGLFGLGDCIMMYPAIKALKENYPEKKIYFLTMNKQVAEFYSNSSYIDEIFYFNFLKSKLIPSIKFIFFLRKLKPIISIMGFPANKIHYSLISFLVGGKIRLGHSYLKKNFSSLTFLYTKRVKKSPIRHCVLENLELVKMLKSELNINKYANLSIDLKQENIEFANNYFAKQNIDKKLIGIHAGCSIYKNHLFRRWPKEKFRELLILLSQKKYQVILFGDKNEYSNLNQEIAKDTNALRFYDDSILNTAAIIKKTDLFISNDSGLMHLAAACNCKVLAIIGPTNKNYIHPFCKNYLIAENKNTCRGCFEYSKIPIQCLKYNDFRCIKDISVKDVFDKAIRLLT